MARHDERPGIEGNGTLAKKYLIRHGDAEDTLELRTDDDGSLWVREEDEGDWSSVHLEKAGDSGLYMLLVNDRPTELYLERRRGGAIATIGRHTFDCDVTPWRPGASGRRLTAASAGGPLRLVAPMTGSVVEVRCAVGQEVAEGDVLLVIESMKMNNEFRAPGAGTVESIAVKAGDRVSGGQLLVTLHRAGA